jgi:hypothetical protein
MTLDEAVFKAHRSAYRLCCLVSTQANTPAADR